MITVRRRPLPSIRLLLHHVQENDPFVLSPPRAPIRHDWFAGNTLHCGLRSHPRATIVAVVKVSEKLFWSLVWKKLKTNIIRFEFSSLDGLIFFLYFERKNVIHCIILVHIRYCISLRIKSVYTFYALFVDFFFPIYCCSVDFHFNCYNMPYNNNCYTVLRLISIIFVVCSIRFLSLIHAPHAFFTSTVHSYVFYTFIAISWKFPYAHSSRFFTLLRFLGQNLEDPYK
jgi:hypothetical protein